MPRSEALQSEPVDMEMRDSKKMTARFAFEGYDAWLAAQGNPGVFRPA